MNIHTNTVKVCCECSDSATMMLGKRARPPMKRTTSMNEFILDLSGVTVEAPNRTSDPSSGSGELERRNLTTAVASPRRHRRDSAEIARADFLSACSFCKRRLIPGRDIYMYRGDTAFCSLECRQQQMNQDELKEKCSLASRKESVTASAGSQVSGTGESVAAV